jgi:hypothetical protein
MPPTKGNVDMPKERHNPKEAKKKPALTLKEKRNVKKSKHEGKALIGDSRSS